PPRRGARPRPARARARPGGKGRPGGRGGAPGGGAEELGRPRRAGGAAIPRRTRAPLPPESPFPAMTGRNQDTCDFVTLVFTVDSCYRSQTAPCATNLLRNTVVVARRAGGAMVRSK